MSDAGQSQSPFDASPQPPAPGSGGQTAAGGYPAGGYAPGAPVAPSAPPRPQGLAITSLVTGVVGLLLCLIPGLGIVLGVAAVIFGIIALRRRQNKGMALGGLITGALAAVINTIMIIGLILIIPVFGETVDGFNKIGGASSSVEYTVSVSEGTATVEYTGRDGTASDTVTSGAPVEISDSLSRPDNAADPVPVSITVTADGSTADQQVSCDLTIDDELVDQQSGSGTVTCTGAVDPRTY